MSAFMKRIGRECLAIDELLTSRDYDLIFGYAVIGIIAFNLADRAEEEIVINHLVDGRMAFQVTFLVLYLAAGFRHQLFIHFRTCLLQIGLSRYVEHVIDLKFRIDLVLFLLLTGEILVIIIGDMGLRFLIDHGERSQKHREGFLSRVDSYLRQLVAVLVTSYKTVLPGSKNTVKMGIGVQQNREQEYSKNGNKNTVISINIINQGLHCIINKKQDCDGLKNKITYHYVSRDSQAS